LQAADQIRQDIEGALSSRIASALTPALRTVRVRTACGDRAIDELLGGGLPVGGLVEFVGEECSGRTTMAMAYLRAITSAENVCAWIDVADALDPETAAANGVDLERLLWVRCGIAARGATPVFEPIAKSPAVNILTTMQPRHTGGGSPHPRSEGHDMPEAITAMMQAHGGLYQKQLRREKRSIGTPGARNRPLSQASSDREEQVATDRLPARRGEHMIAPHTFAPRCAESQPKRVPVLSSQKYAPAVLQSSLAGEARHASKPWQALDQALRSTDLLLQAGGFSAIVLDLGSTQAEFALRIPLATWFRFRAACERTGVSLLLLSQQACARSAAELVVRMQAGSMESAEKVMTGVRYQAFAERQRFSERTKLLPFRKPSHSEHALQEGYGQWRSETAWAQTR
jgi:recombination protein RecA